MNNRSKTTLIEVINFIAEDLYSKKIIEEEIVRIKEMGRTDYLPNLYKMLRDK